MFEKCIKIVLLLMIINILLGLYNIYTNNVNQNNNLDTLIELNANEKYAILTDNNINDQYLKVAPVYTDKNADFVPILFNLSNSLNFSISELQVPLETLWHGIKKWPNRKSIIPVAGRELAQVIKALKTASINKVESDIRGSQLKLLLTLDGDQTVIFKPKRYNKYEVFPSLSFDTADRHNAEVLAFILALLLDFRSVPVTVIRKIHLVKDAWAHASPSLKKTFNKTKRELCIYGECMSCHPLNAICLTKKHKYLEGSVALFMPGNFTNITSPWIRQYSVNFFANSNGSEVDKKRDWETDSDYCQKVKKLFPIDRILDFVDATVFDFLLQNYDRHHYEFLNELLVLLDNGKGLENPHVDRLDILAPLYQCCILRLSTWERLLLLSGNTLSSSIKTLQKFLVSKTSGGLTTDLHLEALDRRLLKIYSTVLFCIKTKGQNEVFK